MKRVFSSVFMGTGIIVLVIFVGIVFMFLPREGREEEVAQDNGKQAQIVGEDDGVPEESAFVAKLGYAKAVDTGNEADVPYLTRGFSSALHLGIDVSAENKSSNLISLIGGTVIFAGYCVEEDTCDGSGNAVIVEQEDGMQVLYAHLDSFVVNVGDIVSVGQKLGVMGAMGRSAGPCVHIQVCKSDCSDTSVENLIDPQILFFPEDLN